MCAKENQSEDSAEEENLVPYHEQVDAFTNELESLIARFSNEYDLTRETMIGCLYCSQAMLGSPVVFDLGGEMLEELEEEDE